MTNKNNKTGDNLVKKGKKKPHVQEALAVLTKAVAGSIPEKVTEIRKSWQQLKANTHNTDYLQLLHRQTHTLSGTMGTYGFEAIADCAHKIELTLQTFNDNTSQPFPLAELETLLDNLEKAAVLASRRKSPQMSLMSVSSVSSARRYINSKIIYLVDDDDDFLNNMEIQIRNFGYEVHSFSTLAGFDDALTRQEPGVVVMDVMFGEKKNGGIEHITQLNSQRDQPLTTIFITGGNDLNTRLGAVRANGNAYFTKPVLVERLVDTLDELTHQDEEEPFRIVIVDDSKEQSSFTALILQQAGMKTREVNGPLGLLTVLTEYPADLILMDLYMPDCSGLELSQVIRQIDAYIHIPIVFLSDEKDLGRKLSALSLGGDDFLSKPVEGWHLISAVTSRVLRGRMIRKHAESDGLTGLLNHSRSKERLDIEINRAKRDGSSLSFAILDIDHFKHVNDTYGHPVGDRVLKNFSNLLKQRLRGYDIIGRYGGEEFVVILPNTEIQVAQTIMDKLRVTFSELIHYNENGGFSCQFSCGITSFPDFKSGIFLIDQADKALYEAKKSGRNKVVCRKS
jgi:diguanylate cyclase (GGDEF)-like protein